MIQSQNQQPSIVSAQSFEELAAAYSSWVLIDSQALAHNISAYYSLLKKDTQLAVVLKSNAYGHGLDRVAVLVEENRLVGLICVVSVSEALQLRLLGIKKPILVLSILDADLSIAIKEYVQLVAYNKESLQRIHYAACLVGKIAKVHLKFDTGLSRLGVVESEWCDFVAFAAGLEHIEIVGMFTHLADAESSDQQFSNLQLDHFLHVQQLVAQRFGRLPLVHYSCSAGIGTLDRSFNVLVRLGIGLYGLWPSAQNREKMYHSYPDFSLKPAMSWYSRLIQLKSVLAGAFIGYDMTFVAPRSMRLAILPVGYWDGFDRRFSNNGAVSIGGQIAPVVGRVSMNLTIVDVTHIPHVQEQDPVLLLGDEPGVRAEDLASRANTINYEIVTRINPLLPRCAF